MIYDLWDLKSANLVGVFESEAEALAFARSLLAVNPPEYANCLSLGYEDENGDGDVIAQGAALADLLNGPARQSRWSA